MANEPVNLNNIDIEFVDKPIIAAIKRGNNRFVKESIESRPQNLDETNITMSRTPILWAAAKSNIDLVRYLADKGANLNMVDEFYLTILDYITADMTMLDLTSDEIADYEKLISDLRKKGAKKYSELIKRRGGGKKRTRRYKSKSKTKKRVKFQGGHGLKLI